MKRFTATRPKKGCNSKIRQTRTFLMGMVTMLLMMALSVSAFAAYNQNMNVTFDNVKINVNGSQITPKDATGRVVEPFIYQGTTYLPVRAVGEATGYTVTWDQNSKTVYMTLGSGGGSTGGNQGGNQGGGSTTAPATNMGDTMKPYSSSNDWCCDMYPSTGSDSILLGGNSYKNAFTIRGAQYDPHYASFNLGGKYSSLGGTIGLVDGKINGYGKKEPVTVSFYGDGVLLKSVDVPLDGGLPSSFSINVSGVSSLKVEVAANFDAPTIGFADLKLS